MYNKSALGIYLLHVFLQVCICNTSDIPHVSKCYLCEHCDVEPDQTSNLTAATLVHSHLLRKLVQRISQTDLKKPKRTKLNGGIEALTIPTDFKLSPSREEIKEKQQKANCTHCYGCSTSLRMMQAHNAFGKKWDMERGASQEWLFYSDDAYHAFGGKEAVVKVWCAPYDKRGTVFRWHCAAQEATTSAALFLLAQQRVAKDCGLDDMAIGVDVKPVNALFPGTSFHIWWDALWMEKAEGLSMNQLSYISKKMLSTAQSVDLMVNKLNKTQVVRAALYDLLTSQCDRHAQNVFINERGNLKLIDNLQALKFSWYSCAMDSIFLPGTKMNEVVRFGGNAVGKKLNAKPRYSINPMIVMDYRCYVEGGRIGTNYPPQLAQCLTDMAKSTPMEIAEKYKFPFLHNAEILHSRATDMITRGFEWTLQYGSPTNDPPKRYKWHQPCCSIKYRPKVGMECAHKWNVTPEFPLGDPISGRNWTRNYPDPGKFVGGTVFE